MQPWTSVRWHCIKVWQSEEGERVLETLSQLHSTLTAEHVTLVYIGNAVGQTAQGDVFVGEQIKQVHKV